MTRVESIYLLAEGQDFFSVNGQATTRRSRRASGEATRTVEPLNFGNTTTKTAMPHIRVALVFPSHK